MDSNELAELTATVTHVVSCFGSVDWNSGPRTATELHLQGTRYAIEFARSCRSLERIVHLSSVLVLGRASGRVTDELELGQSFRNWYEYGKYLAEQHVRGTDSVPWRVVRVGGVIGPGRDVPPDTSYGLLSVLPFLLRGYPIHLTDHGRFPCYVCDVETLGEVLARAAFQDGERDVWTWFDDALPSLADVLTSLCTPWSVVPKIVSMPLLVPLARAAGPRLGLHRDLLEYVEPWTEISPAVLAALPPDLPRCPAGYVQATGEAIKNSSLSLIRS